MVSKMNEQIVSSASGEQITKFGKQRGPFTLKI
jgi:hypothetical protein